MNTYPCAELEAKHVRLSEDIDIDRRLGDTPTIP